MDLVAEQREGDIERATRLACRAYAKNERSDVGMSEAIRHIRALAHDQYVQGCEAAAALCERVRCRNWDAKECAKQIRDMANGEL